MELVAKVPRLDSAQFDKIMNSTMQVSRVDERAAVLLMG